LPFGPWAEGNWLRVVDSQGEAAGFWARVVATVESVLAIVLVFLFALAVRICSPYVQFSFF
jgi:hypothetical protein